MDGQVGIWNGTLATSLHRKFVGGGSSLGDGSAIGSPSICEVWWRGLDLYQRDNSLLSGSILDYDCREESLNVMKCSNVRRGTTDYFCIASGGWLTQTRYTVGWIVSSWNHMRVCAHRHYNTYLHIITSLVYSLVRSSGGMTLLKRAYVWWKNCHRSLFLFFLFSIQAAANFHSLFNSLTINISTCKYLVLAKPFGGMSHCVRLFRASASLPLSYHNHSLMPGQNMRPEYKVS